MSRGEGVECRSAVSTGRVVRAPLPVRWAARAFHRAPSPDLGI